MNIDDPIPPFTDRVGDVWICKVRKGICYAQTWIAERREPYRSFMTECYRGWQGASSGTIPSDAADHFIAAWHAVRGKCATECQACGYVKQTADELCIRCANLARKAEPAARRHVCPTCGHVTYPHAEEG